MSLLDCAAEADVAAPPKPKKEPGILKKARMELLAEGNRKAASRELTAALPPTSPSTLEPAPLLQSAAAASLATAQVASPAVVPSNSTPHGAASSATAPPATAASTSPGIVLRSQRKVRRQPSSVQKAPGAPQGVPAAAPHPIDALTNAGSHVSTPAPDKAASRTKKQRGPAQTSVKPGHARQGKHRKSL